LFRPQALRRETETQFGAPVALLPVAWSWVAIFMLVLVLASAAFLATASYARKESARGILRPERGEVRVMASRGGTVRTLSVADGDWVGEGQTLAWISTGQALEGGGLADEAVLEALAQEEASLRARLEALGQGGAFERTALIANQGSVRAERAAAAQSIVTLTERRALAQDRLAAAETLIGRGLIAAEEVRRRREAVLATEQAIVDAQAQVASLDARLAETNARLSQQAFSSEEGQAALEAQLASLEQRRAQAEAARGYELRASVSGQVSGLQVTAGQSVDPQRPIMTISPGDQPLVAEIYVPSRAIGFIEQGQSVRLLYDAFPYQRFGPSHGIVHSVSGSVLAPNEVAAAIPLEEPVYRVLVTLDAQAVRAFGHEHAIQSGMALTADIVLEERSFLEWLLEPVLAMRGRL
jgi:membrane fusion protein